MEYFGIHGTLVTLKIILRVFNIMDLSLHLRDERHSRVQDALSLIMWLTNDRPCLNMTRIVSYFQANGLSINHIVDPTAHPHCLIHYSPPLMPAILEPHTAC